MMMGFWILIVLFIAGLWWFGRASKSKTQCACEAAPEVRPQNCERNRLSGGD